MEHVDCQPGPSPIVRQGRFDLEEGRIRNWNGGSPVRSHLFNALSTFLPSGEAFFIQALKDSVAGGAHDPQVATFIGQEAAHRRQHEHYNKTLVACFPRLASSIRYLENACQTVTRITPARDRLALTVAIEHLTTLVARAVLRGNAIGPASDEDFATLWRWHSLEELEHKAIAHDAYVALFSADGRRVRAMRLVTLVFSLEYIVVFSRLLVAEGLFGRLSTWSELWSISRSQTFRTFITEYRDYFRRNFHPLAQNDTALILTWREDRALRARVHVPSSDMQRAEAAATPATD